MVQLVLDGLSGRLLMEQEPLSSHAGRGNTSVRPKREVNCFHVNCRLSADIEDIGTARWKKLFLLMKYCFQAIRYRFCFGVTDFFYIPASSMRSAICRDWLVMALCRPFFPRMIYYWQAAGLERWLASTARPWERWLTELLLGKPDLSIVLGESCRNDAVAVRSRRIVVVPNSIPDPCPEFISTLLPQRTKRAAERAILRANPSPVAGFSEPVRWFRVLFLGLCYREKGLFDTVEGVAIANRRLSNDSSSLRIQLCVAGRFYLDSERQEFERRIQRADLATTSLAGGSSASVSYHGFVTGDAKRKLFQECDCFCFPTYYFAESFPLVLLEAMAYGMDIVATDWRNIPELLPPGYPGAVKPHAPEQIASAIGFFAREYHGQALRSRFENNFTPTTWLAKMKAALNGIESGQ